MLSEQGVANVYFIRDERPRIQWLIDLGIPNFTCFMLELPIPIDNPAHAQIVFHEGTALLLQQIKVFLAENEFGDDAGVLQGIMDAIHGTDIQYASTELMYGYEILFTLTKDFYTLVRDRLVRQGEWQSRTAGREEDIAKAVWRGKDTSTRVQPWEKGTVQKRDKKQLEDARSIINRYRQTIYKNTPGPLYVMLFDRAGMPRGVSRVTNKGLTKWAEDKTALTNETWKGWWLLPDGDVLAVPSGYEHFEVAAKPLGFENWDDSLEVLRAAFTAGWMRVSIESVNAYVEMGRLTDDALAIAQEFFGSIGGLRYVTVEIHDPKERSATGSIDEFLSLSSTGKVWRMVAKTGAVTQLPHDVEVKLPLHILIELEGMAQQYDPDAEFRFVGGCVRDMLLDRKPKDVDVVTNTTAETLERMGLENVGKAFPVYLYRDEQYGQIEVAVARTEIRQGTGHGGFQTTHTRSFEEDMLRRDLTINVLMVDAEGVLYGLE